MKTCRSYLFRCHLGKALPTEHVNIPRVTEKILFASDEYDRRIRTECFDFREPLNGNRSGCII